MFPTHPETGRKTLNDAWGSWLTTFPWSDFFTGTFENPRPTAKSCLGCVRGLWRYLPSVTGCTPQIFAVVEGNGLDVRLHVHALVGWSGGTSGFSPPPKVRRRSIWDYWHSRYGRARCVPVSRARCFYTSKYVVKSALSTGEILFLTSDDWPPYIHT